MASPKPLIVPWLIQKIDSRMYPGLEWVNSEKTQFKVPWKHHLRQDLCMNDTKIFEDWAIDSGRYDPTKDNPDPKRWKKNFGSALTQKKDIVLMVVDNSKKLTDPHRIYELLRKETGSLAAVPGQVSGKVGDNPTFLPMDFRSQSAVATVATRYGTLSAQMEQLNLYRDGAELYRDIEDFQNMFDNTVKETDRNIQSEQEYPDDSCFAGACAIGGDVTPGAVTEVYAEQQAYPVQEQETFKQQILSHFTHNSFETNFEVKIYYRGKLVKSSLVSNRYGFCLTSREQPSPGGYLQDVTLPKPETEVTDKILIQTVNRLLPTLDQGTLVEVRNGVICARRLGACKSFWSITETPNTTEPNPIDKDDFTILYTLQQFITELIEFMEHRRKDSPKYSIWICLGERWPDRATWKNKCVMVEIVPVVMRLLHEMSYSTGASSLSPSDVNLEISDSLSATNAIQLLRDIKEMMDWTS
ncbi:interferon regulatory factor 3-like isoform X1 [Hyperolius riggenbachi]|uniref:interferon regulatory factor 3-like isoform X1 n=1 Tax=Hyperolius riggenbachi TaxID=752182 RepID=UPI0035A3C4C8